MWGIGLAIASDLGPQLFYHVLALQVPDFDAGSSSSAKPIAVGREAESIDGVSVVQGVQVFAIIQVPEHGLGIFATRSTEGTIRGHGHGVQVAGMTNVVGLQLAVGQVPYLK